MIINNQGLFNGSLCIVMFSLRFFLTSALPLKDRCVLVGPEIPVYRVQGDAVIIRFPFLEDAVNYRSLPVDNSSIFQIRHSGVKSESRERSVSGRDRVMLTERRILLLPSHSSDSGTYTYTFRSDTVCLTGSIAVMIFETEEPDRTVMPYTAHAGEDTEIICPHLRYFQRSENPQWYKDFQSTALPIGKGQYTIERDIILSIRNISEKDEGFYTCRLSVIFNNTQYNVSRTWRVQVSVPSSEGAVTSNSLSTFTSSTHSLPYIVFPTNGSFTESHLGARLVIQCMVSVGNQPAQSTEVTWVVNDQPLENSYLGGRAFQTEKSVSGEHLEVQLVILELLEEDHGTELKCICQNKNKKQEVVTRIKLEDSESVWLVIAVSFSCFTLLLCIFTYHLCKRPHKRKDYVLARQSSII